MRTFSIFAFAALLGAAPSQVDSKREQHYSDRLRRAQREYMQIMEEFDQWCSSHGQRVGVKGAPGDLGCVAPSSQPAAGQAAAKPDEKK